jgi:hypothetical protein
MMNKRGSSGAYHSLLTRECHRIMSEAENEEMKRDGHHEKFPCERLSEV